MTNLESLVSVALVMPGAEYLTAAVFHSLWGELGQALVTELGEPRATVQDFLKSDNRRDEEAPFAFLVSRTLDRTQGRQVILMSS